MRNDLSTNQDFGASYDYNFSKDNYIMPFQESSLINNIFSKTPLIKIFTKPIINKIEDTKIFYSPDKISTNISISENDQLKIMRQGLDSTKTYSLDLNRKLTVNHKVFDNYHANYTVQVGSDLYHQMEENSLTKLDLIEDMNPGLIENISQSFSNTYTPKLFFWLEPQFKYSPSYTWSLGNPSDTVQTSTIKNSSNFETKFDLNPKEIFEILYNPSNTTNGKKSSSRRGRGSSSKEENKKDPLLKNVKNPLVVSMLKTMHSFASKFSKIQFRYELSQSHTHNNILADQYIDYYFRLGVSNTPNSILYSQEEGQLGSFSHSYSHGYRFAIPSISVIPSVSLTSLEFKSDINTSIQSTSIPSSSNVISYYPFPWEVYGDKGLFLPSWGLTWSGLEKISFISDKFKSFKFSHNAKGQRSSTYQDGELLKTDYSLLFSPLLKLSARSKGKNPVDFEIGSKYGLDIFSEGSSVEHEINIQIYAKIEYSRSKGIYIPLPILRDLDLNNTVSFSFNTDFESTQKLVAYEQIENRTELNLDDSTSKLSFSPKMSYQFSQWVSGNIFFKYILSNDINTGLRDERDFGFNLTIQIRG